MNTMTSLIWTPPPGRIAQTNMSRFLRYVQTHHASWVTDYAALYQWSIADPQNFWAAVWTYCDVRASQPWDAVLSDGDKMPGARWFIGARLNYAENLLRRRDDHAALVFRAEERLSTTLSYRELYTQVARLAAAMRQSGVTVGDRVAGFMPNIPETVVALLATASIGAIWSACSPDFGTAGAIERFGQIEPKMLFAADGYYYKGRAHDSLARLVDIARELPSVQKVIIVPYTAAQTDLSPIDNAVLYPEFLSADAGLELHFEQLPFDHPLYILYSSGTTGRPKCIVHGAGGTLLQHLKELVLHTDLKQEDRIFYYTTCGWMMWNWVVSSLATGATVLLYDGSPFHPHPGTLFDYAEQAGMTIFGTSAKYLAALEKAEVKPIRTHSLDPLKTILSTGSPLAPESYDYVYRDIKSDLQLASISGGTDIVSCFALGNPLLPVYRGELQCRGLGMQVEVYDEQGHSVQGRKGELVCTAPAPSMPLYFWNDPGDEKYRAAYFATYPGVWAHGDYAELTTHDGLIIYGRSDAVLNPGGVRIGTAEIYRQVEKLPEVLESIAIGQEWRNDMRIILFVKLREDVSLTKELIANIKTTIRDNETPRHVPAKVLRVSDIPRTLNGKIMELAVRNVVHGRRVRNIEALANPQALQAFKDLPELQTD